jgi:hypothetical protein
MHISGWLAAPLSWQRQSSPQAATAMAVRSSVLQRIDTQQSAWQSGDTAAMRRLRLIHWSGMLANVVVIATVAGSVSFIF